jgi:hypothetical protein
MGSAWPGEIFLARVVWEDRPFVQLPAAAPIKAATVDGKFDRAGISTCTGS